jgi:hypothetical protein
LFCSAVIQQHFDNCLRNWRETAKPALIYNGIGDKVEQLTHPYVVPPPEREAASAIKDCGKPGCPK